MTRTLTSDPFSRATTGISVSSAVDDRGRQSKVQAAAPAMPPLLVTVVKAAAQDVPKYLDEIGRNAAFESVT
jgi:hypothetical protein